MHLIELKLQYLIKRWLDCHEFFTSFFPQLKAIIYIAVIIKFIVICSNNKGNSNNNNISISSSCSCSSSSNKIIISILLFKYACNFANFRLPEKKKREPTQRTQPNRTEAINLITRFFSFHFPFAASSYPF